MTKVLGVTGGIGSGKSTICKVFNVLGWPVYNSDEKAKVILHNKDTVKELQACFGDEILVRNQLNTAQLAKMVFSNTKNLQQLNAIIHPKVAEDFSSWKTAQNSKIVVKEAAILFESGAYKKCNWVLNVQCSPEIRIQRVFKRDGREREEVEKIINNQLSEAERSSRADFNVKNETNKVLFQIIKIFNQLSKEG